jgi:hypothetical protein
MTRRALQVGFRTENRRRLVIRAANHYPDSNDNSATAEPNSAVRSFACGSFRRFADRADRSGARFE